MHELGHSLLVLARHAIAARLGQLPTAAPPGDVLRRAPQGDFLRGEASSLAGRGAVDLPELHKNGATFVTLTQHGRLRGCIGSLEAWRPLAKDVHENALAAAFRDQRFKPLGADELLRTQVEVSLLTPAEPLSFASEADALAQLRPKVDGVIFTAGGHRSTFLPQVWEQLPEPTTFMAHLKEKAGLPADYWGDDVRLERYSVKKWKEAVP